MLEDTSDFLNAEVATKAFSAAFGGLSAVADPGLETLDKGKSFSMPFSLTCPEGPKELPD